MHRLGFTLTFTLNNYSKCIQSELLLQHIISVIILSKRQLKKCKQLRSKNSFVPLPQEIETKTSDNDPIKDSLAF